jgi:hypothetical protein
VGREVIESLGGRLGLRDREDGRRGAVLTARWPRSAVETPAQPQRSGDATWRGGDDG